MTVERRQLLAVTATAGLGLVSAGTYNASAAAKRARSSTDRGVVFSSTAGDATKDLQAAIDRAASLRVPVHMVAGTYDIGGVVRLRSHTKLIGSHGLATINLVGSGTITADEAGDVSLTDLRISGGESTRFGGETALLALSQCNNFAMSDVVFDRAPVNALKLWRSSGRVNHCRFERIGHTAIVSGNAVSGLDISHNTIRDAGNNGIVVWRDAIGPDGTIVSNNNISDVRSVSGGSGQNGNGINVFRSGNVIVATNTVHNCTYSAVRCNSASNAQIIGNNCRQAGEVALYAEFSFEGAVIANNIVDGAASGVVVTNSNKGGRLATVQGNLIRNLVRREHEPVDKRGVGIAVEADTVVNGNTIEGAPTAGIVVGWGPWLRQVTVTANLIRDAEVGITVSAKGQAGAALISNNVISSVRQGGIRLADYDKLVGPELKNAGTVSSPAVVQGNLIS